MARILLHDLEERIVIHQPHFSYETALGNLSARLIFQPIQIAVYFAALRSPLLVVIPTLTLSRQIFKGLDMTRRTSLKTTVPPAILKALALRDEGCGHVKATV